MITATKKKTREKTNANDSGLARRGKGEPSGETDAKHADPAETKTRDTSCSKARPSARRSAAATGMAGNGKSTADRASNNVSEGVGGDDSYGAHTAAGGGDSVIGDEFPTAATCRAIQELQRQRVAAIKARIAIENQLAAVVSTSLGYHAGMEEKDRKAMRAKAIEIIKSVDAGDDSLSANERNIVSGIIDLTRPARDGFGSYVAGLEKEMVKLAKSLPIAAWIDDPERRGFGILSLAIVIGEAGDLSNYANPAKLWKRLGCAPFKGKMPSTWRSKGGLSAEEWTEVGYSPRRRSISFLFGENIVKQNKGEYRKRYDEVRAAKEGLEDWPKLRAHRHAMLLATKRLLRDLWRAWNTER